VDFHGKIFMKEIKGSHILVIGSGPSVKKYWDKIEIFIKENNVVTFGCNVVNDFINPDYHFWGSAKRWREFGHLVNKKSILVFSEKFLKSTIREKWDGKYLIFKNVERLWKPGSEDKNSKLYKRCQVYYKNKKMFGCFKDIATLSIFWAYIKGASKISVVGNDGYTFYKKSVLNNKIQSQHCYGKGLTDGFNYTYCRGKDWDKYRTLRLLYRYGIKKYGFGFEFITPTIYDEFYNPNIFKISKDLLYQKWIEPDSKEYNSLYIKGKKKNKE
jgi:hypothetical protein